MLELIDHNGYNIHGFMATFNNEFTDAIVKDSVIA